MVPGPSCSCIYIAFYVSLYYRYIILFSSSHFSNEHGIRLFFFFWFLSLRKLKCDLSSCPKQLFLTLLIILYVKKFVFNNSFCDSFSISTGRIRSLVQRYYVNHNKITTNLRRYEIKSITRGAQHIKFWKKKWTIFKEESYFWVFIFLILNISPWSFYPNMNVQTRHTNSSYYS